MSLPKTLVPFLLIVNEMDLMFNFSSKKSRFSQFNLLIIGFKSINYMLDLNFKKKMLHLKFNDGARDHVKKRGDIEKPYE